MLMSSLIMHSNSIIMHYTLQALDSYRYDKKIKGFKSVSYLQLNAGGEKLSDQGVIALSVF